MSNNSVSGSGLRTLSREEMMAISGGEEPPKTLGTITVTATAVHVSLGSAFGGGGGGSKWGDLSNQAEPDLGVDDEAPILDVDDVVIENKIGRPLTEAEKQVINKLATAISSLSKAIGQLSNTSQVTMPDGSKLTGAQIKAIWGEMDFIINPAGTSYSNPTTAGQGSAVNYVTKEVKVNIDHLAGYAAWDAPGMNYYVLHEFAHMTTGSVNLMNSLSQGGWTEQERAQLERYTNDIARAIGNATGHSVISNPGYGYSN